MRFSTLLFTVASLLLPIALLATTWLYAYPFFHGCDFPTPERSADAHRSSSLPHIAPFRLLALGDPQLEGDTSLPNPEDPIFPSLQFLRKDVRDAESWGHAWQILQVALKECVQDDIPSYLGAKRKELDLWGNDYYLAHIVRRLTSWTKPTHVAVLGDLLGSQWIDDAEFEKRSRRFWGRVFKEMERVPDAVMNGERVVEDEEWQEQDSTQKTEILGNDRSWERRIINIAGNHDIGYAGDLDDNRIQRFERAFGKVNWDISFTLPRPQPSNNTDWDGFEIPDEDSPALRLVILNTMNLDSPVLAPALQSQTYDFMNEVISTSRPVTDKTHATILLTHIPLHKDSGICVDDPFFDYFNSGGGGVKEQNTLSQHASKMLLEGIFGLSGNPDAEGNGLGRRGIIINGHDHEGCDVLHYFPRDGEDIPTITPEVEDENTEVEKKETRWKALRLPTSPSTPANPLVPPSLHNPHIANKDKTPHIREVTLRSMMGDFGGYAGFLSAWFDEGLGDKGEWRIEFSTCGVGVQHWWWGVHGVDLAVVGLMAGGLLIRIIENVGRSRRLEMERRNREHQVKKVSLKKRD